MASTIALQWTKPSLNIILIVICLVSASPALAGPLHDAVKSGDLDDVQRLISAGQDVNVRDKKGETPLHWAADGNHYSVAKLLIKKGAYVNARDMNGNTPLHYAAYRGNKKITELLISKGADINAKDNSLGVTPLWRSAEGGQAAVAELLINKGAQVDAASELGGLTPLQIAAARGHAVVVKLLVEKGAKLNATTQEGMTALDLASRNHHQKLADWLSKHGAKHGAPLGVRGAHCTLSDLGLIADIPKGYVRIPTVCPKIAYTRLLNPRHAIGFLIIETPYPYHSSDPKTPLEAIRDYVVVLQVAFDQQYRGQNYNTRRIDQRADFPQSFIAHRGACAGLATRTPEHYQGLLGVEWRRGIMCLVEIPPKGSEKWALIQAFFFDKNLERPDYKPPADFEQQARKLFRSLRIKEPKGDGGAAR